MRKKLWNAKKDYEGIHLLLFPRHNTTIKEQPLGKTRRGTKILFALNAKKKKQKTYTKDLSRTEGLL